MGEFHQVVSVGLFVPVRYESGREFENREDFAWLISLWLFIVEFLCGQGNGGRRTVIPFVGFR